MSPVLDLALKLLLLAVACGAGFAEAEAYGPWTVPELVDSLHRKRNEQLYYDDARLPENLQDLIRIKGINHELIEAFEADHADRLFRFNLVTILSAKIEAGIVDDLDEMDRFFQDCFKDPDAWIRTESVWGIKGIADSSIMPKVRQLLQDPDEHVRSEAETTLVYLSRKTTE